MKLIQDAFKFMFNQSKTTIKSLCIKQYQSKYSTTNRCICQIKYRTKKDELVSSYDRHPSWPVRFNKRKVEHVHYFSV